jgi:hypothetical protein
MKTSLIIVIVALLAGACAVSHDAVPSIALASISDPTVPLFVDNMRELDKSIAIRLLPGDSMFVTSIAANSRQDAAPISFPARQARNQAETGEFINARNTFVKNLEQWHGKLIDKPPTHSDIFDSIALGADHLHSGPTPRKVLIAMSDMQDNVTRGRLFTSSLENIDVLVLFAYPHSQAPADYEPFRQALTKIFQKGRPRSLRILFPTEAVGFNVIAYLGEIRR